MLDMFFTMLSNEGNVNDNVFKSRVRVEFVFRGVLDLSGYEENLMRIVQKIKRYDRVMEYLNFNVGAALLHSKPENANRWFNMVIDECGLSLFDICEGLCSIHGVTTDQLEGYLRSRVAKTGKLDMSVITAFNNSVKQLGTNERSGIMLFEEGIRSASPEEYNALVQNVQKCLLSPEASLRIFEFMDQRLMFRCYSREVSENTFESMKKWGARLKCPSQSMPLHEFCTMLERAADPGKALSIISNFTKNRIKIPTSFISSQPFEIITEKIGAVRDGGVYLSFLTMFDTEDYDKLVTSFTCLLLDRSAAANVPERQMIPLCSAALLPYRINDFPQEQLAKMKKLILEILEFRMADNYRPNLEAKIIKSKECEKPVRDALLKMIKNSRSSRKKPGLGGIINTMFNRDK